MQGLQGITGEQGLQGLQGITGEQGAQGLQGIQGNTGLQGLQGITGEQGLQGLQGLQGNTGLQGLQGLQGNTGLQGLQGLQGITGEKGTQGTEGSFGGASFDYTFDTSTADSDPGTGKIRLSNSTQTSAAEAYIDITDDDGNSIQSFLLSIKAVTSAIKGHMRIASRTDSTQFLLYPIDDLTDNTGWWTLDLDTISSSGGSAFINNQDILISFTTVGDRGDTGAKRCSRYSRSTRPTRYTR